jgi:hypothetical protein
MLLSEFGLVEAASEYGAVLVDRILSWYALSLLLPLVLLLCSPKVLLKNLKINK